MVVNLETMPVPLRRFYEGAIQILEKEKPKLGRDFNNLRQDVDDLFSVASKKLQPKQSKQGFVSRRFSPRGPRKILSGWKNTSTGVTEISPEQKQKAIENLGLGLKSVADAMNSAEMTQLANVLIKQE